MPKTVPMITWRMFASYNCNLFLVIKKHVMKKTILMLTLLLLYGTVNAQCELQIDSTFTTYTQPPDIDDA